MCFICSPSGTEDRSAAAAQMEVDKSQKKAPIGITNCLVLSFFQRLKITNMGLVDALSPASNAKLTRNSTCNPCYRTKDTQLWNYRS